MICAFCTSIFESSVGAFVSEWNLKREDDLEEDGFVVGALGVWIGVVVMVLVMVVELVVELVVTKLLGDDGGASWTLL